MPFEKICQIAALSLVLAVGVGLLFALKNKRKKKTPPARELQFTLPDRENTFVRTRLSTVLNTDFTAMGEQKERLAVDFTQALQILEKIKTSPLSPAEQIEVARMQSELRRFSEKELFSAFEATNINDSFSKLLKLSAKYKI
ncbi:MAG: hypothetical protein IJW60_02425 [Clostridia bacterium]|nr:hypothetical protein [Clostridia bacterium]